MDGNAILQRIHDYLPALIAEFDVETLVLFDSFARGGEREDIDTLVSFKGPVTFAHYFGLQFYLEYLLYRPIDLVTDKALHLELRSYVEREGGLVEQIWIRL